MASRLRRYEIRQEQQTRRNADKNKMYQQLAKEVFNFINRLPDEVKIAFSSELLMRSRNSEHQKQSKWKHEFSQIYVLLNQNIGARNNMLNTRAISNVFSVSDVADIIKASQPALPYLFPKGEK